MTCKKVGVTYALLFTALKWTCIIMHHSACGTIARNAIIMPDVIRWKSLQTSNYYISMSFLRRSFQRKLTEGSECSSSYCRKDGACELLTLTRLKYAPQIDASNDIEYRWREQQERINMRVCTLYIGRKYKYVHICMDKIICIALDRITQNI